MPDLWSLVHREFGPISTFLTREEAERELQECCVMSLAGPASFSVEPFSFR